MHIAGSMAALAAIMPPADAGRLLRRPLCAALTDDCAAVRDAALGCLPPLVARLGGMEEAPREALGAELHAALQRVQVRERQWSVLPCALPAILRGMRTGACDTYRSITYRARARCSHAFTGGPRLQLARAARARDGAACAAGRRRRRRHPRRVGALCAEHPGVG